MKRITATEASNNFSRVRDQAEHGGGRSTVGDLVAFLQGVPLPDPAFRTDMLEIIEQSSRDVAKDPWADDRA